MKVALLPSTSADDEELLVTLCRLINMAYEVAEADLWRGNYARTSVKEVSAAIRDAHVATARIDGRIVGSISTRELDPATGWFGALAVDPESGGRGVGRELVAFAEARAVSAGQQEMQLELLLPTGVEVAHSRMLAQWYQRLGYRETARKALEDFEPHAVPYLATPCEIVVHRKRLLS